uniref:Diphosphomevalonate decarboxylase n=1 Tax=Macrostomum lignano TaxID=282301 RepID=A0A1I8HKW5_9PLAT
SDESFIAYAAAAPNLALIKYWGKRDSRLVLPLNNSISVTLDDQLMRTVTIATASPEFAEDSVELNGKPAEVTDRMRAVLQSLRQRCQRGQDLASWKVRVATRNSFPTAAGLASSSSGFADTLRWLSTVARLGSGSACRSLFAGFAEWSAGQRPDGVDSTASQLASAGHWDLRVLVCVVGAGAKSAPSTQAMARTVATSSLLPARLSCLPDRLAAVREAVAGRDFASLAEMSMRDSNCLHAVCADTYPPVHYLTDASRAIIDFVHRLNEASGRVVLGYTADAGPNVCLLAQPADVHLAAGCLQRAFDIGPVVGDLGEAADNSKVPSGWAGDGSEGATARHRIESLLICRLGRGALDIPQAEAAA